MVDNLLVRATAAGTDSLSALSLSFSGAIKYIYGIISDWCSSMTAAGGQTYSCSISLTYRSWTDQVAVSGVNRSEAYGASPYNYGYGCKIPVYISDPSTNAQSIMRYDSNDCVNLTKYIRSNCKDYKVFKVSEDSDAQNGDINGELVWGAMFMLDPDASHWQCTPGYAVNDMIGVRGKFLNEAYVSNYDLYSPVVAFDYQTAISLSGVLSPSLSSVSIPEEISAHIQEFLSLYRIKCGINGSFDIPAADVGQWVAANPWSAYQACLKAFLYGDDSTFSFIKKYLANSPSLSAMPVSSSTTYDVIDAISNNTDSSLSCDNVSSIAEQAPGTYYFDSSGTLAQYFGSINGTYDTPPDDMISQIRMYTINEFGVNYNQSVNPYRMYMSVAAMLNDTDNKIDNGRNNPLADLKNVFIALGSNPSIGGDASNREAGGVFVNGSWLPNMFKEEMITPNMYDRNIPRTRVPIEIDVS